VTWENICSQQSCNFKDDENIGENMTNNEMDLARGRVYQLLSSLFAQEIDQNFITEFNSKPAQDFWQQMATQDDFSAQVKVITQTLSKLKSKTDILELAADYCGLFLVGTKHSASPYASLYLNEKDATLFGEQHQAMTAFLQQSQLELNPEFKEPADHIAVILAYSKHLVINETEAAQLTFLQTSLNNWLDKFVLQISKTDQGQFYTAVAQLTQAWVNSEVEWLKSE